MPFRPAVAGLALGIALVSAVPATAAGTSAVAVGTSGPSSTRAAWSGTFPTGANAQNWLSDVNSCQGDVAGLVERHPISVSVPAGAYDTVKARMIVNIESTNTSPPYSDIVELIDPSGRSAAGAHQEPDMTLSVTNPAPGTWTLLTCSFVPVGVEAHSYKGSVVLKTRCKTTPPCSVARKRG